MGETHGHRKSSGSNSNDPKRVELIYLLKYLRIQASFQNGIFICLKSINQIFPHYLTKNNYEKTTGYFMEDASGTELKMSSVTISGDVLNTAFNITGYDVTLSLKKVEDDFSTGSLMDMFPAEAKRVKE